MGFHRWAFEAEVPGQAFCGVALCDSSQHFQLATGKCDFVPGWCLRRAVSGSTQNVRNHPAWDWTLAPDGSQQRSLKF